MPDSPELARSLQTWGGVVPVETRDAYDVAKDAYNTVRFAPIKTSAIRLDVVLPVAFSAGIQEWKVK